MTEVRVFPPGVLTGVPFVSVNDAAMWLEIANAGEFGHPAGSFDPTSGTAGSALPKGSGPKTPQPWPTEIPTDVTWPTEIAYVRDERFALPDGANPVVGAGFMYDGIGYLPAPAAYWCAYDPWARQTEWGGQILLGPVGVKYSSYRLAMSWHNALRRTFDTAKTGKERSALAGNLGLLEETVMASGAVFTAAAGAWVTTVWADCSTRGDLVEPTDPDDRRPTATQPSTFRLA